MPLPATPLSIATRGSPLALWQARHVSELLQQQGHSATLLVLKTTADRIQDRFLHEIGGKGLFIKELEEALEARTADLAVHSLKDMRAVLDTRYVLAAVLPRHAATDLIIFRDSLGLKAPASMGPETMRSLGSLTVATGSLRRQAILKKAAPELKLIGIRGNVDTRLRKLQNGDYDALILAEASIERLAIQGLCASRLDPTWFIPCAAQGALAIETLSSSPLIPMLGRLSCADTTLAVNTERLVLAGLGGDCHLPFGCYVRPDRPRGGWQIHAGVFGPDGHQALSALHLSATSAEALAQSVSEDLRRHGAGQVLKALNLPVPEYYQ